LRVVTVGLLAVAGAVAANQVLNNGRWNPKWLIAAVVLAVLAEGLDMWLGTRDGDHGLDVDMSTRVTAAADLLADQMAAMWRQEATQRRIITPAPATVRWRWADDDTTAPRFEVAMPPAPGTGPPVLPDLGAPGELLGSGAVTRLHDEVYAKLPYGRLVMLGGAGAGKTGAMILLLLAALDRRASLADDRRARVPVPVWLTLGRWDSTGTTLFEWAVATMNRDHPALLASDYGPDAARELLRGGRVALFLDGLDELPGTLRARALERLNEEARGLRVVITSRPEEYQHTLQASSLENTAVIELRPVRPAAATTYLLRGQAGLSRQRWEQVGAYLEQHPDSVAAKALDNPLYLSLARDTYASQNPIVLTNSRRFPTVKALNEHLVDRLLFTVYPDEHQRMQATHWLAWIAQHLGKRRELNWWDVPMWVPSGQLRLARGLAVGLTVGLGIGLGIGLPSGLTVQALAIGLIAGLFAGVVASIVIGVRSGIGFGLAREPHRLVPHWPRASELKRILRVGLRTALAVGLVVGLPIGFLAIATAGTQGFQMSVIRTAIYYGLLFGLITGLTVGLAAGILDLWATPIANSPSATPAATYRADRRTSILYGVASGFAFAVSFAYPYAPVDILSSGATLLVGFGFALVVGQVPIVKLAELVLTCQSRRRVHFLSLLEDAYDRQILRQAGAFYQFRHAVLQDHLATMYASTSRRPTSKEADQGGISSVLP
jgi:hypothetical protein